MSKVAEIMVQRFLDEIEKVGSLPWQNPYTFGRAVNWETGIRYNGVNRLLLPTGEYLTKTAIAKYNKVKGTNYRFQKGIIWYPVVYYSKKYVPAQMNLLVTGASEGDHMVANGETLVFTGGKWCKLYLIAKYFNVAERKHFVDPELGVLPAKWSLGGGVTDSIESCEELVNTYVNREGIPLVTERQDFAFYHEARDIISIPSEMKNIGEYYSTIFHEMAHSTKHSKRLGRSYANLSDEKALEECVAEICASLLCADARLSEYYPKYDEVYENSLAYVSYWKTQIKKWGTSWLKIASDAVKAHDFIVDYSIEREARK